MYVGWNGSWRHGENERKERDSLDKNAIETDSKREQAGLKHPIGSCCQEHLSAKN